MKFAVIGIIISGDRSISQAVNALLSTYGDFIVGRMGVPDRANNIYIISVIIHAELEIISALTGKLGRLDGVKVKSAIT